VEQQTPSPVPTSPRTFSSQIQVNVGNVDVTVLDSKDRPVIGLTRDDFVLYLDGEERSIDYFGAYARESSVLEGRSRESSAAFREAEAAAQPDRPRVTAILVDNANTSVFNRNHLLSRVTEHINETLRAPDRAIVAVYENYLRFASRLTTEPVEITQALEELRRHSGNVGGNQAFRLMAERQIRDYAERSGGRVGGMDFEAAKVSARVNAQQMRDRTRETVDAFKVLLRTMSGVPGRKSVLYLSDGLPRSPGIETFELLAQLFPGTQIRDTEYQTYETTPLWLELGRWAAAADVTLYTVDARGLAAGGERSAEHRESARGVRGAGPRTLFGEDIDVLHLHNYQDPLIALANITGGMAVVNTNKFDEGLDRIADSMETYYSLGFDLEPAEADQRHGVRIEVKDREGLRLHYRTTLVERSPESRMADRTYSGLFFSIHDNALAIRVELGAPSPAGRKRFKVPLKILVPADKLALLPQEDTFAGTITVWTVAAGGDGKLAPLNRQEHKIIIPADKMDRVGTLTIETSVEAGEGECRVSVGVLNDATGETGFGAAEAQLGRIM
jgi:VWFA-related protein